MGLGQGERGYAMAALLVGMTVMAVLMSAAMPVWTHQVKREKEEELIWRGQQYARAIGLFQRKYANAFPPSVDVLVEQRFLRKKYKDPITGEDFQPIPATGMPGGGVPGTQVTFQATAPSGPGTQGAQGRTTQVRPPSPAEPSGAGGRPRMTSIGTTGQAGGVGIQGVVSKSTETSIKIYNGRTKYNEWAFVYMQTAQRVMPGGVQQPGGPQQPGVPQQMFGPGGTTFTPMGGSDRRPPPPGGSMPFGQPQKPPQQPPRPPGG